jgi:hypothetical protein
MEDQLHKTIRYLFAVLSASTLIPAVRGQTPERPPEHGAQHEKLAYFVGKWVYEEDVKPTAYSRSGKYIYTESCEWFAGECRISGGPQPAHLPSLTSGHVHHRVIGG